MSDRQAAQFGRIDAQEHYKQRYESADKDRALLTGLLIGLVAGLLWEALRR